MLGFVAGLVLWQLPGGLDGLSYQKIGFGVMGIALVALVGTSLRHRALTSAVAFTWTPGGTVAELIKSWQPQGCKTHRQHQKSLAEHLAEKLPDVKLTLESGSSRVRADIEVGKAVIVELKVDLPGQPSCNNSSARSSSTSASSPAAPFSSSSWGQPTGTRCAT